MDFSKLIKQRRSTRSFTDQKLTSEQVEEIVKAGLLAPSSKNKTPWEFILIEDKAILQELSKCKKYGAKPLENCTLAIIILGNPLLSDVWIEDTSIASIMMQLQAEDLGLGSCWIQIRQRETEMGQSAEEYVKLLLNIPLHMQVLNIIAIGHKQKEQAPKDEATLKWENVHIGNYKHE